MKLFVVCILALSAFTANGLYADCGLTQEEADALQDEMLERVEKNLDDPMTLDAHKSSVVNLKEGQLWGLNKLKRKGQSKVSCDGDNVQIQVNLKAQEGLKARWEWDHTLLIGTKLDGIAYLKADVFEAKLVVIKDKTGKKASTIKAMDIVQLKDTEVNLTGLAHLGWVLSRITTHISKYFEGTLKLAIDQPLTRVFDKVLLEMHAKEQAGQLIL